MIERYISHEMSGRAGAYAKAGLLVRENGYKILKIEHTLVPMAGSSSTPYSSTWGREEYGYCITVDTEGYEPGESRALPEIKECLDGKNRR